MNFTKIKLGGVPEHFNLPIHLAIEKGLFAKVGIDLEWTTYAGGTGEMTKSLRTNEADACILLTEGITTDIINGNPSKIISEYVSTPLIWGIHTGSKNSLSNHKDIYDKQYAISRNGSGSHLMAIIDANENKHKLNNSQFEIIKNLDGALTSLDSLETDVFYWEKYTTKPYVDSGQLKRVGEFPTPWPAFVIAATDNILSTEPEAINTLLKVINKSCIDFMADSLTSVSLVSKRYNLKIKDTKEWFNQTKWATNNIVSDTMLQSVVNNLKFAGIIPQEKAIPTLVWAKQ